MAWILEDHEREALEKVAQDRFRDDVIAHAKRKAVFEPPLESAVYEAVARETYERVYAFLTNYETATYDSYVFMMLIYFGFGTERVEGGDMQATLRNDRIGINTRVRVCYDLMKVFMEKGL